MTLDCVASFIAQTPTITPTQLPDGLTQPQATIWAALIAVGAATIALIGVIINAVISQRQHRDKERAALKERAHDH
ncbi:hypothetical protein [Nocardia cyriacigeorgica]|uniref:hypothetical protein n=1 Tax=Nocardia cyriacigeorgica TaxID=135487 RepID=UPI001032B3F8|nr:hypothetical protein [Nocardia cyriacigeorgica]